MSDVVFSMSANRISDQVVVGVFLFMSVSLIIAVIIKLVFKD